MIVFCHLLNDNSGSPIVLRAAIQGLACGDDYDGSVLLVGSQGRGCLDGAGVPIYRYWYFRSRYRIITLFSYVVSQLSLYRALSRLNPPSDVIIYVNTSLPFGAALWGYYYNRPVIYHLHEVSITPGLLRRFLVWMIERTAHHIFYVSNDQRNRLPIRGLRESVLPNPVPQRIADQGFSTQYAPRRSGRFEVLMLASPRHFKGVPEFLDLARGFEARDDFHFRLVLNGSDDEIAAYLPEVERPVNLTVHGRTDDPGRYYATADVLLNLSRIDQWIETFGMTIVEGMAFGLPVIGPPVGGPVEIVTEGLNGYLVDSRDYAQLRQKLLTLADNPMVAMAISHAARRRARDFTYEHFVANLKAVIDPLRKSTS